MRSNRATLPIIFCTLVIAMARCTAVSFGEGAAATTQAIDFHAAAREVATYIQTHYFLAGQSLYAHSLRDLNPEFMWGNGVMFSALLGAARDDPKTYGPIVARFFKSMDRYWDLKSPLRGYEPAPTSGNGHDKYYDDNAWMVLTFTEAYAVTGDKRFLARAEQVLTFVLSGWDDRAGGGIWWHEGHKGNSKNTCANAPAAVGCLRLAQFERGVLAKNHVEFSRKIVEWTTQTLQAKDGLFGDSIEVGTGKINGGKLTYNSALMLRAFLELNHATGDEKYLKEAKRIGTASDWFLNDRKTNYRDDVKWSHLQIEADLQLYRATQDPHILGRAATAAMNEYLDWQKNKPDDLIDEAAIARSLWLMTEMKSEAGRKFWTKLDALAS